MKRLKSMLGPQPSREDLEREAAEELEAAGRGGGVGEMQPPPAAAPAAPPAAPPEALLEPEDDQDTGDTARVESNPAEEEAPGPPLRAGRTRKNPPANAAARRSAGGKVRVGGRQP